MPQETVDCISRAAVERFWSRNVARADAGQAAIRRADTNLLRHAVFAAGLRLLAGGEGENLTVTRSSPQAALHIDVEGARLQVPTDPQVELLAQRAAQPGAVLPAGEEHFVKWLEGSSPQEIERDRIARVRSNRDLVTRPGWTLDLAVLVDGEPVGLQSVSGFDRWPTRRIVGTTSWLLRSHQGRGLGTRCRAAVLELSFAHLGAESAKSWVLADNHASVTVSTKLGYRHTSTDQLEEHGRVLTEHVYQLDAGDWLNSAARRNVAPVVTGAGGLVTLLST